MDSTLEEATRTFRDAWLTLKTNYVPDFSAPPPQILTQDFLSCPKMLMELPSES